MAAQLWAADPPPSATTTTLGMDVTNPVTGDPTKVLEVIRDPAVPPAVGAVAFIKTTDGHVFLVKAVGEIFYNNDEPPEALLIVSKDPTTHTVEIRPNSQPAGSPTTTVSYQGLFSVIDAVINPPDVPIPVTPPVVSGNSTDGVRLVNTGSHGSNGRDGALIVPPKSGGNGASGPATSYPNGGFVSVPFINTTNAIGIEVGSIGGNGGSGGDSYLSVWGGRSGGNAGSGGVVSVITGVGHEIATTGNDKHGIFAYSRGGVGGSGGSGYAAPGGGAGGAGSNGGDVTVFNEATILTRGEGAFGIYALSVGNSGGSGGSTWGVVGAGGRAGTGGNGGTVTVTNSVDGTITTSGDLAHGILAQSIGGTGGSAGTSGNLLLNLSGVGNSGGTGGTVEVFNSGKILTGGAGARGIFAQSVGGGGGTGGSGGGLVSLGGSGGTGGSAGTVTVTNQGTGIIQTQGIGSDGIMAQSVGGSGGSGSNSAGLVALGGSGSVAGDGGLVTVENYGQISTASDGARGIVAQSIGGGGGDGGSSGGMVSVGGTGNGGGDSATVTVVHGGLINTLGNNAQGILAQSVGGGGGNGGSSGSIGLMVGVSVGGDGGKGGKGGNVDLTLQGQGSGSPSVIATEGNQSHGIFAQSVGGGGGNGGGAVTVTGGFEVGASFAIGGKGGTAGDGGVVTLDRGAGTSQVWTEGDNATGVFLQSVGGGGGSGGFAVAVALSSGLTSGSLSVAIGGDGGGGGKGGDVTVGSFGPSGTLGSTGFNGSIHTEGDQSTGFLAQSVGGGGGNGGLAVAASGSAGLTMSGALSIGLGGKGSGGGQGGTVQVGTEGNITTLGSNSTALLAQSIGGGGGNGGGSIAASLTLSGGPTGGVSVGVGGDAGTASNGGDVTVATRSGIITTTGDNSKGIVVQSVGGGGGNGGYAVAAGASGSVAEAASVNVGLGGKGGGGGDGGTVKADLQSDVNTSSVMIARAQDPVTGADIPEHYGRNATGILVQSIGGGGGAGGFSVASGVALSGGGSGAVSVGLGGSGGAGGEGGTVTVTSTGQVTTRGDSSSGLVAQSIGGGGGSGGFSVSVAGAASSVGSGAINVGLGGSGGAGNFARDVTVNTSVGKISTFGADSHGILAQSLGGGGGAGGYNIGVAAAGAGGGSGAISVGLGGSGGAGGYAGTVRLTVNNDVSTAGKNSSGVVAQAIGGGGGTGGYNVSAAGAGSLSGAGAISVGLGGSGGSGNHGGEVYTIVTGNVDTALENSHGVLAQSIGGGGGNGGYNVSVTGAGGQGAGAISVGLGGNGAGGGNGLKVELTSSGTIHTKGADSSGLMAQSIGGGGGSGGFNVNVAVAVSASASGAISVGLGGSGAGGGDGGAVTLRSTGGVLTEGNGSIGIGAQSIGGGGGSGGFNVNVPVAIGNGAGSIGVGLGGSGGGGGHAVGTVDLRVTNNVTTKGKKATAVLAQSIGGGGGNGGFDITAPIAAGASNAGAVGISIGGSGAGGGNAGIVISAVTGILNTEQEGSLGILAQSLGGGGGSGGMAITGAVSLSNNGSGAVSIGLGGSGGAGGNAGNVTNTLNGSVYTIGKDSSGVAAQSIGGGGGSGGISISGAIALAKDGAGALAFGLGGSGGAGGDAGALVQNTVIGYVHTQGDNSYGVLSQSMGGGGGNGGLNVSGTITAAKSASGGLAIGIGGLGGDGGDGKEVISSVTGGVVTEGKDSIAIAAQSLGGGGGAGGLNVTGSINATMDGPGGTLGVGIGGFGGAGGNAGSVTSTVVATSAYNNLIGTIGDNSIAILAQSVGGGGGNGGLNVTGGVNLTGKSGASIGVGLGGFGGVAGNGGVVTANVTGDIITQGNESHGIVAQSIGGSGGNGGINVTGTIAAAQSPATSAAVSIGVGGFGGNGGTSDAVTVNYSGTLTARPTVWVPASGGVPGHYEYADGAGSNGIMAQSIGGGGGNGGLNVSGGISYVGGTGNGYGVVVGVGGFGGNGGNAGTSTVNVTGGDSITAYGTGHSAIVAQSLGGGGGNGGMNISGGITSDSGLLFGVGGFAGDAGTATTVRVTSTTDVFASTLNANEDEIASAGILAQSIGGGGGNGGLNVTGGLAIAKQAGVPSVNFGIGGFGGAGASSGDVIVTHTGNATTSGNWVHGIMAQSIAGGGGNGGMNVGGQLNFAASENSGGNTDLSIIAGIGGTAGDGSVAGNVIVTHNGIVTTVGDHARGVAAQSIGGGGGTGGMNVTGVYAKNSNPITVGIGGTGGSGGEAGTATIIRGSSALATGKVSTDGIGAHAVEASSIGGGGGDAGMNFNVGYSSIGEASSKPGFAATFVIGGGGGDAASGNAATVINHSAIETKQDKAYGILAQSIGGGGGNANFNIGVTHAGASTSAGSNLYNKPNQNMALSMAVGGATGDGGHGGDVTVTQVGDLTTAGKQAIGILAQSIGGGGGNAGLDVGFVKADGGKLGITLGREGGTGGYGGTVQLSYTGILNTTGEMAFGLLAQSIGNGGGNSSSTTISGEVPSGQNDVGENRPQSATLAIGLAGGVGGYGGHVILNSDGRITTRGRRAYGVFAQSVGGGGGNGGNANSFGITAPVIALTLGGAGGNGGHGGQVDLNNTAVVETFGEEAVGILAQSIGGGGGNGGSSYAGGTKTGDTGITVGIGGVGGPGMDGGIVNVTNDGIVVTHDLAAHGILAQSIGGGGGDGGSAISILGKMHPSNPNATDTTRVSVNVGGNGGTGGDGNAVNVTNHGGIGTYKAASVGIFAQSIGGGGGNGRSVLSASLAGTSGNNVGINIGGTGGTGGTGGVVTVKNEKTADPDSARIITLGDKAHGILAMSVGGGGGTGSNVAAITRGTGGVDGATTVDQVNFTMGGSGGSGGTGGMVIVSNDGLISTQGLAAHGIIAQSIGGGGGQGGMAISGDLAFGSKIPTGNDTYNVAIGGQGGSGNAGGEVRVTNSGTIHVKEDGSYGIYAQSVGGGGGDGGFAASFSRNLAKNPKETLAGATSTFALGGFGGTGGDGGPVTVTHTGTIIAEGDNAYGIFAQSVSGGGGNSALSISSPVWIVADLALKTIIGGGSSGTAGKVTINTSGDIITTGKNSMAFFSQSVNGGGGNTNQFMDFSQQAQGLGDNGLPLPGNGGDIDTAYAFLDSIVTMGSDAVFGTIGAAVEAVHLGSFYSDGDNGGGGLLQSIGGGGGRGSQEINMAQGSSEINLVVVLGGTNVSDSSGGDVTYNQTGSISVTGDQSAGVTVQTIGGGGGTHFVTLRQVPQASPPPPPPPAFGPLALPAPPPLPGAASLTLGANGGMNNHGGIIHNNYVGGVVDMNGDRSAGLIHQSIGAGGGIEYLVGATGLNANLGGQAGASGDGGDITIVNTRDVGTQGILSHGIMLQSIGGGGGAVFTDLDPSLIAVALNTANTGNGGNVMLTQNGDMYVMGDRSTAIILQSLGGGGGMVDDVFAGAAGGVGNSGAITLIMNGDIVATGAAGSGIFAQSQGTGTQGNINVTLVAGKSLVFGDAGTGVKFSGGAANLFTNNGTIVGTEGVEGWAFRGEDGDDVLQNSGTFVGQADFGTGANAFNNTASAVMLLGPQFFLGAAGNTLTNDGEMHIGGTDLAQHTDMTGGFTQTSTGTTFTELDFGTDVIDNVSMTGAASFDGSIEVALLNPQLVPVGTFQKILFHADGGVTDNGMDLVTAPSVVINYGLNYLPGGQDLALDYSVNFNPPGSGMSRNLVEVGAHINSIQNAGSSPSLAAVIIRLLYEPTMDGYRALLSQMGPEFYGEQQAEMLRGTQRFGETVLGGGNTRFMAHGRRIWFDVLGSSTFHGRFDDYKTTQQSTTGFALGFESLIGRGWSAGLAVALEDNMATGYEGRWSAEGTSQRVGGVVRFRTGATEFAGLLSYGWNQMDSSRVGQVANPFDTNVERNIQTFTAMVRASHQFGDDSFAVVPRVDVGVTHLSAQNATESGADAISLYLHDVQETHAWLRPAVTIRKAIPVFREAKLRIQAEFGYQYYLTGNDTYVKGGFTGAPGNVDPMNVPIDLGSMATLSVGAQLLMANDLSIGLYYTKALSQKYKLDVVNLRVNKDF